MNILVLTSTYPKFAGDATAPFIESMVAHVARLGHQLHVVVPEHRDWDRPAEEDGVHFHVFRYSPRRSWTPWGYAQSLEAGTKIHRSLYGVAPLAFLSGVRACSEVARRWPIDVVHAHWVLPNGPIAAASARRQGLPLVITVHGSDVVLSERSRWMGSFSRWSLRQASAVTAVSQHMLDRAGGLGARAETLELIPLGVDLLAFHPDQSAAARTRELLRLDPDQVMVLGIGRLIEWKGFDHLIEAMALVRDRAPEVRLVIAGDGDLRPKLMELAQTRALGDRVRFVGMVERSAVPGYFAAADLVAVPSVHHEAGFVEGLGYVALEALASGKPVIASHVGGLPEVVRDGETGRLVQAGDPVALADAIVGLARDADLRSRLGANAHARALELPSWQAVAQRWVTTYERVARTRAQPQLGLRSARKQKRRMLSRASAGRGPLNILCVTSTYPKFPGDSTAPFMASITEHIAALGHTVHVVLPEHRELRRDAVEGTIHFHPYRYSPARSWTPWGYAQSLESGTKLKRALYALAPSVLLSARQTCNSLATRETFDVIHAHWVVPNGTIAQGISARRGIPLVITLHGSDVSLSEQSRWIGLLARRAFAKAAAITAPSQDLLERAERIGAEGALELIPWGADPNVFRPDPEAAARVRRRYRLADDDVVVVGIGRFVRWKGFDDLIAAVAQAHARKPKVRLVLVGDGDERSELEGQVMALGLEAVVSFAGMAERGEVNAHLSAADIVVVPSVHHNGFVDGQPTVALEAMAAAKPLVVTRVGGLPDLVVDGENGHIVEERNREALARAIISLAGDAARRTKMGEAGRARVRTELNWDTVAERLVSVYEAVRRRT